MGDSPLSTGRSSFGPVADGGLPADGVQASVPAWLAARRSREKPEETPPLASDKASEIEFEFEEFPEDEIAAEAHQIPDMKTDEGAGRRPISLPPLPPLPPDLPSESPPLPKVSQTRIHAKKLEPAIAVVEGGPTLPEDMSLKGRFVRWIRSTTMAGVLVSFVVHSIVLTTLAILVIGGNAVDRAMDIFGALADPNENAVADIELDSAMPLDPGKDAAPLEFPDMTQLVTDNSPSFDPGDSLRGAVGGTGKGSGEGGEGEAMSLPHVNVPKYAVTKGSFSAWTEPRDPEPGRLYVIVIQVRLPPSAKTYRGSDLSGMVIGTDLYKQLIDTPEFRRRVFPIEDGGVQIRIPVPGAAQLVRDTIRIESKLLREKQVLEIEF